MSSRQQSRHQSHEPSTSAAPWEGEEEEEERRSLTRGTDQERQLEEERDGEDEDEDEMRKDDGSLETRSCPGELETGSATTSSGQHHIPNLHQPVAASSSAAPYCGLSGEASKNGHRRNAPGFTSGPPFSVSPKRSTTPKRFEGGSNGDETNGGAPWARLNRQDEQQIDQVIDRLASDSQPGLGRWRPNWLRFVGTRRWMLFWLSWYCAVQGLIINGLVPSTISTIEKRFSLSTSSIARILQCYDVGYVLLCIPVSYFGGRHSKPAVLAAGALVLALGSFIFSTPHLLSDSYTTTSSHHDHAFSTCQVPSSSSSALGNASNSALSGAHHAASSSCSLSESQPGTARWVFLLCVAHFLHGIGATPLFTIGVSYIDENVGPALSSLYVGIFYACAIFGPAFGFVATSTMLKYHTDFLQLNHWAKISTMDETDPRWVGAWWAPFQMACLLGFLSVLPLAALPKVLPESLQWHRTRLRVETITGPRRRAPECCGAPPHKNPLLGTVDSRLQLDEPIPGPSSTTAVAAVLPATNQTAVQSKGSLLYQLWMDVRHIPIAIYRLLTNGSFMLLTLAMAIDGLVVAGVSTYMSKYLERQFGVAPSRANVLIGCIVVPTAGVGTMFSGFIVQYFRLSCVRTVKLSIALLVGSLLLSPMYMIYCDHDPLVGVETFYPVGGDSIPAPPNFDRYANETIVSPPGPHLRATCNDRCDCLPSEYHPVCAVMSDGTQTVFYSPCYAGCPAPYSPSTQYYENCTCVPTKGGRVKRGFCESKCSGLTAFLVLFAPLCFCTFAVGVPLISVVLRTVDYAERSFALGIQWILVRVIGTIPAPQLFGWMFEVSCTQYEKDHCSSMEGSCILHRNKTLSDLLLTLSVVGQLLAAICLVVLIVFYSASMKDDDLPGAAHINVQRERRSTTASK